MNISEQEKDRIRGLHKNYSIITEQEQTELPLCSEFKNFLPANFGWFAPDWDKDGNMILYATKDHEWTNAPPSIKDKDYCRACK
jgi:hypothetical protein